MAATDTLCVGFIGYSPLIFSYILLYHAELPITSVAFSDHVEYNKKKTQEETEMEAMNNLLERRSIRKYKDTQVPDDLLDKVLKAGLYAPTGMNRQNVIMVAVRDKQTRDQMMKMNAAVMGSQNDPFYGAPCVIVVLGDPETYPVVENGSLVLGNLMNAAHALGLGSCWIHRAKQTFETEEGKELLRKWGLKDTLVGIGNCILGYPDEEPAPKPRLDGRIVKIG